jgi:SAM-dependent methyltransferase
VDRSTASRFVHRRALAGDGDHDYSLDIASDAAPNYLKWIGEMCGPFLGARVLDLGAGHGAITQHFLGNREVTALDLSDSCVAAMRQRFDGRDDVQVIQGDLRDLGGADQFDSIVMINVLEHILDDSGVLSQCARHLDPSGNIVLYVPALNGLYTEWDRKVGHFRRYSIQRLRAVVEEAGLGVLQLRYVNMLAIPAWFVTGRIANAKQAIGSTLSLWDRTGTLVSRQLESRIRVPIGLNLFCVASAGVAA